MNLTNLITTLETKLTRTIINTKNNGDTITYKGTINQITVNSEDEYTNVYQLFLTHTDTTVTLHINHSKANHTTDYELSDITSLVIT